MSVDPLASLHPGNSPYAYAVDNPVAYVDPSGRDTLNVDLPQNRNHPGTATLVVNGRDVALRGDNQVLGKGVGSKKNNPTSNPLKPNGNTPTGIAQVVGVNDNDRSGTYVNKTGIPTALGKSGNIPLKLREEGRYFLYLSPLSGQIAQVEGSGVRMWIGMHGGGTILPLSQVLNPMQRLTPTLGCLRFTNLTTAQLVGDYENARYHHRKLIVIISQINK